MPDDNKTPYERGLRKAQADFWRSVLGPGAPSKEPSVNVPVPSAHSLSPEEREALRNFGDQCAAQGERSTEKPTMAEANSNWTIFGAVRLALTVLAGTVIAFVLGVLAESNVRHFLEDRGWDTFLSRALDVMPGFLAHYATWLGIGLIFGAAAVIWLIWAFPHRLGDHYQLPKTRRTQWMTAGAAAILVAGAFYFSLNQPQLTPIVIHIPPTVEDTAKATAPIQSKLDDMTRQRDAALSHSQQTAPPSRPFQPNLSADDIATKIAVWKSIQLQMDDLAAIINRGNNMLATSVRDFRSNPSNEIEIVNNLSVSVGSFRAKLARIRDNYISYADIADALKEVVISGGRPAVPGTIFDRLIRSIDGFGQELRSPSKDFEIEITPHMGALKRDLDAVRDWHNKIEQTADNQSKELTKMEAK